MQITDPAAVGDNIRRTADACGVSQAEVARRIGLSPNGMSRRMTGEMEFRVSELQAIAAFLHVSVDQLLEPSSMEVSA